MLTWEFPRGVCTPPRAAHAHPRSSARPVQYFTSLSRLFLFSRIYVGIVQLLTFQGHRNSKVQEKGGWEYCFYLCLNRLPWIRLEVSGLAAYLSSRMFGRTVRGAFRCDPECLEPGACCGCQVLRLGHCGLKLFSVGCSIFQFPAFKSEHTVDALNTILLYLGYVVQGLLELHSEALS